MFAHAKILLLPILLAVTVAHAEEKKLSPELARVPLQPGAWMIDSKADAFVRLGPGGASLVIEAADSLDVVTHDAGAHKLRLDRFMATAARHFEGSFEGDALVFYGGGDGKWTRVSFKPEGEAVLVRQESSNDRKQWTAASPTKWQRVTPSKTGVGTGIGGVFFKAKDAKKLRAWYKENLGLPESPYGFFDIRWRELGDPFRVAHTVWATFKPESKHFDGAFMVNYRVDDLDALVKKLERAAVKIERREDEPGNGRFAWIRDGENNLVELWEPSPGG